MTADRGRGDGADAAEDAVRKIQRLKKAFGRSKLLLTNEEPSSLAKRTAELAAEIQRWDEQLEAIRDGVLRIRLHGRRERIVGAAAQDDGRRCQSNAPKTSVITPAVAKPRTDSATGE